MIEKTRSDAGASIILFALLLAGIVTLLGIGRLASYRNQVKMRLDREREIQQTYATRSVLRWLDGINNGLLPTETNRFGFATARGEIGVSICPAEEIFPEAGNASHYDSYDPDSAERRNPDRFRGYVFFSGPDAGPTSWSTNNTTRYGVLLGKNDSATNTTNRLEIDLGTNLVDVLWMSDAFGRRYIAQFADICQGTAVEPGDTIRLGLTPFGQRLDGSGGTGSLADWAVWIEQRSEAGSANEKGAPVSLWRRWAGTNLFCREELSTPVNTKGIQLSSTHFTLLDKTRIVNDNERAIASTHTYTTFDLGEDFARAFDQVCRTNGGMRMTLAVDILRSRGTNATSDLRIDRFTRLSVTPAYEYATLLDWLVPDGRGGVSNAVEQSTVVRLDIGFRPAPENRRTITYDTHGTYMKRKNQVPEK